MRDQNVQSAIKVWNDYGRGERDPFVVRQVPCLKFRRQLDGLKRRQRIIEFTIHAPHRGCSCRGSHDAMARTSARDNAMTTMTRVARAPAAHSMCRSAGVPPIRMETNRKTASAMKRYGGYVTAWFGTRLRSFQSAVCESDWRRDGSAANSW